MNVFIPAMQRFVSDHDKKKWFEYFLSELIMQCANAIPPKLFPKEFEQLKRASNMVVSSSTDIQYLIEANRIANAIVFSAVTEPKRKDRIVAALTAVMFTCAAEMVKNRNVFTIGYTNQILAIACENIIVDAKKKVGNEMLDEMMYDNYPVIGDIARSFCNNEEVHISVAI
jgi:hypothetical protein